MYPRRFPCFCYAILRIPVDLLTSRLDFPEERNLFHAPKTPDANANAKAGYRPRLPQRNKCVLSEQCDQHWKWRSDRVTRTYKKNAQA